MAEGQPIDPADIAAQVPGSEIVAGCVLLGNQYIFWEGQITKYGQAIIDAGGIPPAGATITTVNPTSGTDGVNVTITGTLLRPNAPAVGKIFIGDVEQTRWGIWAQTTISFTAHQGALPTDVPQTLRVELADGSTVTAPGTFSFTAQPPMTVTGISPTQGADGALVSVGGTNMGSGGDVAKVLVGTQEATVLSWTPTGITINAVQGDTPMDAPMVVTVTRNDGSEAASPTGFTFVLTKDLPKVGEQMELNFNLDDVPPRKKHK
jgi:hypothetical protein